MITFDGHLLGRARMNQERTKTSHHIMLHSGRTLDLGDPALDTITIDDIAHGLSNICRYAGQCRKFYSVAEHSVLVSRVLPCEWLAGLLHDSAEAFVGDASSPLKLLIPEYRRIEKTVESAIFRRFGLAWPPPPEVKVADICVMAAEQRVLMPKDTNRWLLDLHIKPANVEVRGLSPKKAKKLFLDRFYELVDQSKEHLMVDEIAACT